MTTTATRRGMMTAMASASVMAGFSMPIASAHAMNIASSTRVGWDRAFVIMEKAVGEDAVFDPVYMKAFAAFADEAPDPEAVECRRAIYHPHHGAWLADDLDGYEQAWLSERGKSWSGADFEQEGRRQIGQVREYRRLRAIAEERHNLPAIEAEWERLGDVADDARWAVFAIPAPDLAALRWKAECLFGTGEHENHICPGWSGDIIATYMADVFRLLPREA